MRQNAWRITSVLCAIVAVTLFILGFYLECAFFTWCGGVAMDRIYGLSVNQHFTKWRSRNA
jgi:hypothetical protein